MPKFFVIKPCTSANGMEIKFKEMGLDLKKAGKLLTNKGICGPSTSVVLLGRIGDIELSIYSSGRIMVKSRKATKKQLEEFCNKFAKLLDDEDCLNH